MGQYRKVPNRTLGAAKQGLEVERAGQQPPSGGERQRVGPDRSAVVASDGGRASSLGGTWVLVHEWDPPVLASTGASAAGDSRRLAGTNPMRLHAVILVTAARAPDPSLGWIRGQRTAAPTSWRRGCRGGDTAGGGTVVAQSSDWIPDRQRQVAMTGWSGMKPKGVSGAVIAHALAAQRTRSRIKALGTQGDGQATGDAGNSDDGDRPTPETSRGKRPR